jgi:hypothetical protein
MASQLHPRAHSTALALGTVRDHSTHHPIRQQGATSCENGGVPHTLSKIIPDSFHRIMNFIKIIYWNYGKRSIIVKRENVKA